MVLRIEFKSAEELKLQPKTHEEHLALQNESALDEDEDDDNDDDDDDDNSGDEHSDVTSNDCTHGNRTSEVLPVDLTKLNNETSIDFILKNKHSDTEGLEMTTLTTTTDSMLNRSNSTNSHLRQIVSVPPDDISKKTDDISILNDPLIIKTVYPSTISLTQRFYEFYNAPITKFWYNAIFYLLFLFLFTYMVLVRTPRRPTIAGRY